MALAERSKDDIDRLQANTALYQKAVEAWSSVPVLEQAALNEMLKAAATIVITTDSDDKKPK
jgi:hypothetical protein